MEREPSARDKGQVRMFILRGLDRCNGQPMPDSTLVDTVSLAFPHLAPMEDGTRQAIQDLATQGRIAAIVREVDGMTLWVLTDKGHGTLASMPR
jgi:hypothetical protein